MKKLYLYLSLLCLGAVSLQAEPNASTAQRSVRVSGYITDDQGQALELASVGVQGTYRGESSNAQGYFNLLLSSQDRLLRISYVGFETQTIHLSGLRDTLLRIQMQPSVSMNDAVIIRGSRISGQTPGTGVTLDQELIRERNAAASIPYLLEMEPSMVSIGESGSSVGNSVLRIRGTDASRINVNINGVPLNDPESQSVFWVNIPNLAGMAQSIQVQRGIGANNGGTSSFGGAINIQSGVPDPEAYLRADLAYGAFNTFQGSISAGSGLLNQTWAVDAGFTKVLSDGYIRNGFCNHQSFNLSVSRYGQKSLLKLMAIIGKQKTGIAWNGTPADKLLTDPTYNSAGEYQYGGKTVYYDNETDNYQQNHFQLYWVQELNPRWTLNLTANWTPGFGYYENYKANKSFGSYGIANQEIDGVLYKKSDMIIRKYMDNDHAVLLASARYQGQKWSISFGESVSAFFGDHFGEVIWAKYNASIDKDFRWYTNTGHKWDAVTFVKADWNINTMWSVYADMQFRYVDYRLKGFDDDLMDLSQINTYPFVNGKLGVNLQLDPAQRLYMMGGLTHREPTRSDIKDALKDGGQDMPRSERMIDIELGYTMTQARWMLGLNLYGMFYHDQLAPSGRLSDVGYALMENVEKSYRCGIELMGGVAILPNLRLDANLTWSRNKIQDYTYYMDVYESPDGDFLRQDEVYIGTTNLAFSPSLIAAAMLSYEPIPKLKISVSTKHVGTQHYDNTSRDITRLDPYTTLNAKLSYRLSPKHCEDGIEFQFLINNILNQTYINNAWGYHARYADGSPDLVDQGFFPQPGLTLMGRIVIHLSPKLWKSWK